MSSRSSPPASYRVDRRGTLDAAGRLSLGRVDALLGPGLRFAAAISTGRRVVVRFFDAPELPEGWVPVPVVRRDDGYPHLRFTGPKLRRLLETARLSYPIRVHVAISIEARQVALWRVR